MNKRQVNFHFLLVLKSASFDALFNLRFLTLVILSANLLFFTGCGDQALNSPQIINNFEENQIQMPEKYRKIISALEPFFSKMDDPQPNDWLATYQESGQTFAEYLNENPVVPISGRNILYIQPLGKFSNQETQILSKTSEYLHIFYNLPVKLLPYKNFPFPLQLKNRRLNPFGKNEQIKTGFILNELLLPNLPKDAAALIAFTNLDLFPDQNFAFVFGQANLENRIGVWSLYRLRENADQLRFLQRTLKIAAHETGHIFSIRHCTKYFCLMNGANHLGETDKHPLDACPECTAKFLWLTDADARERYMKLAKFCLQNGLSADSQSFQKKAESVK